MLRQSLNNWRQWRAELTRPPEIQQQLSAGLSHQSYLVASGQQRFVVRIENPNSRALAMPKAQEIAAMGFAGKLAPEQIWSDQQTLVTRFIEGNHWSAPTQLSSLAAHIRQLHQRNVDHSVPALDLIAHCDGYWQQDSDSSQQEYFSQQRQLMANTLRDFPEQCFCHVDLNPGNIIQQQANFVFLDWEYAAVCSPYFDLASLAEFGDLNSEQTRLLSESYWGGQHRAVHLDGLNRFRQVVRFVEWLWLRLSD